MTENANIRGGLLKANGISDRCHRGRGGLADEDQEALRRILERDEARARRMKWATVLAWILFFGAFAAAALIGRQVEIAGIVLFNLALLCTASYVLRAWWARGSRLQSHILSVDVRLARIEDLLEKHLSGSAGE